MNLYRAATGREPNQSVHRPQLWRRPSSDCSNAMRNTTSASFQLHRRRKRWRPNPDRDHADTQGAAPRLLAAESTAATQSSPRRLFENMKAFWTSEQIRKKTPSPTSAGMLRIPQTNPQTNFSIFVRLNLGHLIPQPFSGTGICGLLRKTADIVFNAKL